MAAVLSTSFAAPVTDWAATWPLASVTGVAIGHVCAAESELAQVTAVGPAATVTVRRGVEGTSAAAHAASTPVAVYRASEVDTDAPVLGPAAVPLRQATVTLTDARIKALPTGALELVAAPGGTRGLVFLQGVIANHITVAYTNQLSPQFYFVDPTYGAKLSAVDENASKVLGTNDGFFTTYPVYLETNATLHYAVAPPSILFAPDSRICFAAVNSGLAFTGGHPSNTLSIAVLYGVLDLTTGLFI